MNNSTPVNPASHSFFQGMKPEHLAIVTYCASAAVFEPGQIIFQEREPANRFYLVQSGCIALEAHQPANGTVLVQRIGAGDVLGWSWLYPPFVWHFQARAVETTKVIVLDGAHLLTAAEHDRDFGYELMKRVTQIVIRRLQATRQQLFRQQAEIAAAA